MIIGIDPGLHGAIVVFDGEYSFYEIPITVKKKVTNKRSGIRVTKIKKNLDFSKLNSIFLDLKNNSIELVVLEDVHARPKQGVTSVFTFGSVYGFLKGMLYGHGLIDKTVIVSPTVWAKSIFKKGILLKDKKEIKSRNLKYIQDKYPNVNLIPKGKRVPHDGVVDAMLLIEYGKYFGVINGI